MRPIVDGIVHLQVRPIYLEGLAQLVSTRLNAVMSDVIQTIQREILLSVFGMSEQRSKKFQKTRDFSKVV